MEQIEDLQSERAKVLYEKGRKGLEKTVEELGEIGFKLGVDVRELTITEIANTIDTFLEGRSEVEIATYVIGKDLPEHSNLINAEEIGKVLPQEEPCTEHVYEGDVKPTPYTNLKCSLCGNVIFKGIIRVEVEMVRARTLELIPVHPEALKVALGTRPVCPVCKKVVDLCL